MGLEATVVDSICSIVVAESLNLGNQTSFSLSLSSLFSTNVSFFSLSYFFVVRSLKIVQHNFICIQHFIH